jgi:hypothetical protein
LHTGYYPLPLRGTGSFLLGGEKLKRFYAACEWYEEFLRSLEKPWLRLAGRIDIVNNQ